VSSVKYIKNLSNLSICKLVSFYFIIATTPPGTFLDFSSVLPSTSLLYLKDEIPDDNT